LSQEIQAGDTGQTNSANLNKVLGPMHIWALGVGIVLVGEFMGWNFTVAKGGTIGAIIACWTIGLMYISLVMCNTEIGSVIPEAGGQYAMAKYLLGPLAAFNIGLMLVFEYVMLEASDALVVGAIFGNKKSKENPEKIANDMLDFVEFPSKHEILAKELNTVQLKRLELARALSTGCDLLLLDELAAGLTPAELDDLSVLIKKIRDKGVTIIMVEHLMKLIMGVCDRIAVIYFGEKIAEGTPEEITHNEKVLEAYLGGASELT
jgi:ABC-type dipeptide/oligopeptide/nickel transport system ATPase component